MAPSDLKLSPDGARAFVMDDNSVKVIDTATHKVTATWPAAPCEAATGMAFDVDTHRLFLGCDNKLMVMMDSTNGKVIYSVPVGEGVDSTWFDPATKLAFTSNGEAGTVTVAHEDSPSLLKVVQTLMVGKAPFGACLDPKSARDLAVRRLGDLANLKRTP